MVRSAATSKGVDTMGRAYMMGEVPRKSRSPTNAVRALGTTTTVSPAECAGGSCVHTAMKKLRIVR
jgi:hypothetical protein